MVNSKWCPDDVMNFQILLYVVYSDLYGIRGTFLTLNALFRESTFQSTLNSCTLTIANCEFHVASACFSDGKSIYAQISADFHFTISNLHL